MRKDSFAGRFFLCKGLFTLFRDNPARVTGILSYPASTVALSHSATLLCRDKPFEQPEHLPCDPLVAKRVHFTGEVFERPLIDVEFP